MTLINFNSKFFLSSSLSEVSFSLPSSILKIQEIAQDNFTRNHIEDKRYQERSSWNVLSEDVWGDIASFLTSKDKAQCSSTCRFLSSVVWCDATKYGFKRKEDYLKKTWRSSESLYMQKLGEGFKELLNEKREIRELLFSNYNLKNIDVDKGLEKIFKFLQTMSPISDKASHLILEFAVKSQNVPLAMFLFKALNKNSEMGSKFKIQSNLLPLSAWFNCFEMVELLLKNGVDANAIDEGENTALMYACINSSFRNIKMLLKLDVDVNAINARGFTALMLASKSPELVEILLKAGADVNIVGMKKETALMMAFFGRSPKAVELLLRAGADINAVDTTFMREDSLGAMRAVKLFQSKKYLDRCIVGLNTLVHAQEIQNRSFYSIVKKVNFVIKNYNLLTEAQKVEMQKYVEKVREISQEKRAKQISRLELIENFLFRLCHLLSIGIFASTSELGERLCKEWDGLQRVIN